MHRLGLQGIKAELELEDSALESYYANAKFQSDCGDYVAAAAALKSYCDITQTPGVPGSGPNGMSALWGRLACEVRLGVQARLRSRLEQSQAKPSQVDCHTCMHSFRCPRFNGNGVGSRHHTESTL